MSAAVEDYPRTLGEFDARFATEQACRAFLVQARWPEGFRCPRCGAATAWPVRTVLWQCAGCGRQTSVTAGTIFQDTRTPLSTWFRAMWCVTSTKNGTSALALQQTTGHSSGRRESRTFGLLPGRIHLSLQSSDLAAPRQAVLSPCPASRCRRGGPVHAPHSASASALITSPQQVGVT